MSATLKCNAFQNEHVTGRFPSLFPAKSTPGYSNKTPNLLFQLHPWISWEASVMERETHQPYDWKTQFVKISYMGKK